MAMSSERIVPQGLCFNQPVHRFFARLEEDNLALRKAVEALHESVGNIFGAHPCRLFHEGPVESEDFFDSGRNRPVDFGTSKVGQDEHRLTRMFCNDDLNIFEQEQHLLSRNLRSVDQQDLLALMLDEVDAVVHESESSSPVISVVKNTLNHRGHGGHGEDLPEQ